MKSTYLSFIKIAWISNPYTHHPGAVTLPAVRRIAPSRARLMPAAVFRETVKQLPSLQHLKEERF
jgi:hypothetical protein